MSIGGTSLVKPVFGAEEESRVCLQMVRIACFFYKL